MNALELERRHLTVAQIDSKYDKIYRGRDRETDEIYEVNVARLECTCPEWRSQRSAFAPNDVRRVCAHLYDNSRLRKIEKTWTRIQQLFIRYGRTMLAVRMTEDEHGVLAIGEPFAPHYVRAIGEMQGKPVVATYDVRAKEWSDREQDPEPHIASYALDRMRAVFPELFPE